MTLKVAGPGFAMLLALAGCGTPMPVQGFAGTTPSLDPVQFFTGHVRSFGVLENRSGQPTSIVTTDCVGTPEGDGIHMVQTLRVGQEPPQTRDWHMRRTGPGRFAATANDLVGTAEGEAAGRAFHWQWTLALSPGNSLKDVTMDQWWYLLEDGSMLNRTTVRKLDFIAAAITEHFTRAGR